jgi:hypothetical protein
MGETCPFKMTVCDEDCKAYDEAYEDNCVVLDYLKRRK